MSLGRHHKLNDNMSLLAPPDAGRRRQPDIFLVSRARCEQPVEESPRNDRYHL